MTFAQLGTILLLNLAGMFTPGPDVFLIMRVAANSRKHAIAAVAGITSGIVVWASLTVVGTAALFAANPGILRVIQVLGGLWLLYMAYNLLKSGLEQRLNRLRPDDVGVEQRVGSLGKNYRLGLITNLSNPKAVLFFASIMSPFIPAHAPWYASLEIVAAIAITVFVGFSCLAWVVSAEVVRRRIVRAGPWIDIVAGLLFGVVGAVMLVEGIRG
ncbi:LysE family translocator [Corynebacterium epidermidicanis]|uniref:Putative threonine efflux protein n=1 Tax=Corynebacterium epidermidicanis TaxID=1050174 RepID=A0A0G3GRL5_9CORY|nr:LysE family translocator [Corynebacterium epidermidicanis]AKK03764.1 putative threonine efflux protein [Corynebacterium epidermidicanis]